MPSTYSTNLKLELIANGEQSGTWGVTTNTNLGTLLEEAITGYGTVSMADADTTISIANGASSTARKIVLNVTGSLTAPRNLIVPTIDKTYIICNNTSGGQQITVKTSAGSGAIVASGQRQLVYVDSVNVNYAINSVNDFYVNGNITAYNTLSVSGAASVGGNATLTGSVGIGCSPTAQKATIQADASNLYTDWSVGQLRIQGSNTNQRLVIGYDTTNDVGVIQAGKNGTGWKQLWLNPVGGNVYAATTLGVRRPAGDYGVDITTNTGTGNTALSAVGSGAKFTLNDTILNAATVAASPSTGDNSLLVACTSFVTQALAALVPTGTVNAYVGSSAPSGWVMLDGLTIGSASSGATGRASPDTENLFTLLWNSFNNTNAPVSGGRGASAAADWAANKTITLPNTKGRVIAGVDAAGTTLAIATVLGNTGGAQTHTLTTPEMPSHSHGVNDPSHTHGGVGYSQQGVQGSLMQTMMEPYNSTVAAAYTGISIQNQGGGGAHNNVQPTIVMNYIIKL